MSWQNLTAEKSAALMRLPSGEIIAGIGPFSSEKLPPEAGTAFYCNDFALSDSRPWKIPARVEKLDNKTFELSQEIEGMPLLNVVWQSVDSEKFSIVFSEISEAISRGMIQKSVPVVTALGEIRCGNVARVILSCLQSRLPSIPYAFWDGEAGFCGASPELLFSLRDNSLSTMALAGTAKTDETEVFRVDTKEIREHEFVAQSLISKLSDLGQLVRLPREILSLGSLVHFLSWVHVELDSVVPLNSLIRRLHPTPALGPLPRTAETLDQLANWRSRLACPERFGAPFGLLHEGFFQAIVAIRGAHWHGSQIAVPAGCGVIEESRLVNEWRELQLKRDFVKNALGI